MAKHSTQNGRTLDTASWSCMLQLLAEAAGRPPLPSWTERLHTPLVMRPCRPCHCCATPAAAQLATSVWKSGAVASKSCAPWSKLSGWPAPAAAGESEAGVVSCLRACTFSLRQTRWLEAAGKKLSHPAASVQLSASSSIRRQCHPPALLGCACCEDSLHCAMKDRCREMGGWHRNRRDTSTTDDRCDRKTQLAAVSDRQQGKPPPLAAATRRQIGGGGGSHQPAADAAIAHVQQRAGHAVVD